MKESLIGQKFVYYYYRRDREYNLYFISFVIAPIYAGPFNKA